MSKIKEGLVSIIIPCYNASAYIAETLSSIANQTYPQYEIIIVDDGSTDKSKEIILKSDNLKIKYCHKENEGVSIARNYGLKKAKGEFILFLDADDLLSPNFLKDRILSLSNSEAVGCASNVILIDKDGESLVRKPFLAGSKSIQILEFHTDIITCPSSYVFKSSFLKKGKILFNEKLQSSADKYFLLEVLKSGSIQIINSSPMYYRILADSMSHNISIKLVKDQISYYTEIKQLFKNDKPLSRSFYARLCYTIAASSFYSKEYYLSAKYLLKSFILSPKNILLKRTLILIKNLPYK